MVPLEVCLERLEQLRRHLKGHGSCISIHISLILLHEIKFGDEPGHVLAQGLAGRLLLLSDTAVQADGYLRAEVSFFFRHSDRPLF